MARESLKGVQNEEREGHLRGAVGSEKAPDDSSGLTVFGGIPTLPTVENLKKQTGETF